jgi:hypothetical protein
MAEALDQPLGAVPGDELRDDRAHRLKTLEAVEVRQRAWHRPSFV